MHCPYKAQERETIEGKSELIDLPCALESGHVGPCRADTPKKPSSTALILRTLNEALRPTNEELEASIRFARWCKQEPKK